MPKAVLSWLDGKADTLPHLKETVGFELQWIREFRVMIGAQRLVEEALKQIEIIRLYNKYNVLDASR
jgi:hypothetical protein